MKITEIWRELGERDKVFQQVDRKEGKATGCYESSLPLWSQFRKIFIRAQGTHCCLNISTYCNKCHKICLCSYPQCHDSSLTATTGFGFSKDSSFNSMYLYYFWEDSEFYPVVQYLNLEVIRYELRIWEMALILCFTPLVLKHCS